MKEEYPEYKKGELEGIFKKMPLTSKKLLDEFLKKCSIRAGEKKVLKTRRHLIQFYDVTETPLDEQTKETITNFLIILNKSKRSIWTKNEIKVYLKQFLKWHYKDLELIEDIKSDSKRDLNPQKINENNLVTEQDVEKMLRSAETFKEKAYLFVSFETGARPQELANLKWKDIKFEDDYADITLYSNKTQRSRSFPVRKAREYLWELKRNYPFPEVKPRDFVFSSRWRDKPMTSMGLNKMLRRMANNAGIDKDIWNYLFRHTRATRLYEELPTPIVEKLMGHKNMSGIYAHISSKKARQQMLDKIYKLEELNPKKKDKIKQLEKEIKELKEVMEFDKKLIEHTAKSLEKFKKELKKGRGK